MTHLISAALGFLIGVVLTPYLRSYSMRKGENLATHEDINKLVDQVRAVTTATKQIESQISGDLWDRQKRWELKRDTLLELVKRLGAIKDAIITLVSVHQTDLQNGWQNDVQRTANRIKLGQDWLDAASSLDNAILMAGIVCTNELYLCLFRFSLAMREIVSKVKEWDADAMAHGTSPIGKQLAVVMDVFREELDREIKA
jgi:hypothetical protein